MAIGIHRSRPRCGLGGKNSAGKDRELYAIKGTSRLDREGAGRRSSSHADEDETINVRLETWLRATGIATHPSLPRSTFLLCGAALPRADLPKMKRKFHVYRIPFYIGLYLLILLVIICSLLPFWLRCYV